MTRLINFFAAGLVALSLVGSAFAEEEAPQLSIPADPSLPTFVLTVEPVRVVAITENRYHNQLCGKEWKVVKKNGKYTTARPTWGKLNCGGDLKAVKVPNSPVGIAQFYVGEQSFPHLNKDTLAAQFTSALSGIANFRIVDSNAVRKKRNGSRSVSLNKNEQGPYIIRAVVSELSRSGDTGESGTGFTPTSVLLGGFKRKKVNSFIRLEVQLISGTDGRILAAFPAVGTSSTSKTASTLFTGSMAFDQWDKTHSVTAGASRDAIHQAAKQIFSELKKLSSEPMES